MKKILTLLTIAALAFTSCSTSKYQGSGAANYQKLKIEQQNNVQTKNDETLVSRTPVALKSTEESTTAANTGTKAVAEAQPVKHSLLQKVGTHLKNTVAKAAAPGQKLASAGKDRLKSVTIHKGHATVNNAAVTVKAALICCGIGLLAIILGVVLEAGAVASVASGGGVATGVGTYVLGGILVVLGGLAILIGLILLIIALVNG